MTVHHLFLCGWQEIVARCEAADEEVEGVFDIMTLEDDTREKLLQLPPAKMAGVAQVSFVCHFGYMRGIHTFSLSLSLSPSLPPYLPLSRPLFLFLSHAHERTMLRQFCNQYPNIDLNFEVSDPDEVTAGGQVTVVVQLEREVDENDEEEAAPAEYVAHAPRYPKRKAEGWWLVVGDPKTNSLLSIKRISVKQKAQAKLQFTAPDETGDCSYTLYFMCDSYLGCDQEYEIDLKVKEGEDESDDDSDEE
jgi:pre-mRNA-splicing helicase BRR2